ncbi:hypothetical protein ACGF5O_40790 [Streptomyces sp. NPDC048291]
MTDRPAYWMTERIPLWWATICAAVDWVPGGRSVVVWPSAARTRP